MLKVEIKVRTKYAKEIVESIKVDNINLPEGMEIDTSYDEEEVKVTITYTFSDIKGILTVRNTADDILVQMKSIEETLDNLK